MTDSMKYEAACVTHDANGREHAECPQYFDCYHDAIQYIEATPVSKDGVRPWIRATEPRHDQFLVIGGRHFWVPIEAKHGRRGERGVSFQ